MSYYTGIKIELTETAFHRVMDDYSKKEDMDAFICINYPEKIYRISRKSISEAKIIENDPEQTSESCRHMIYFCQNHAPNGSEIEDWLSDTLKLGWSEFNIQTWNEDQGYSYDRVNNKLITDPNAEAYTYGSLDVWVPLTGLGDENIDEMIPENIKWTEEKFDLTMSDDRYKEYLDDRKDKEFLNTLLYLSESMRNISDMLVRLNRTLEDLTKTLDKK